jgi:capsular polysaccharide biosynthesis protein
MQRLNQSSMESQVNQTNVAVLYPATEPAEPSRPRLLLNLFLAIFFGTALGVGLALRQEIIDYRIRVVEDITDLLNLPVLGIIEKTQPASARLARPFWTWRRRDALALPKP